MSPLKTQAGLLVFGCLICVASTSAIKTRHIEADSSYPKNTERFGVKTVPKQLSLNTSFTSNRNESRNNAQFQIKTPNTKNIQSESVSESQRSSIKTIHSDFNTQHQANQQSFNYNGNGNDETIYGLLPPEDKPTAQFGTRFQTKGAPSSNCRDIVGCDSSIPAPAVETVKTFSEKVKHQEQHSGNTETINQTFGQSLGDQTGIKQQSSGGLLSNSHHQVSQKSFGFRKTSVFNTVSNNQNQDTQQNKHHESSVSEDSFVQSENTDFTDQHNQGTSDDFQEPEVLPFYDNVPSVESGSAVGLNIPNFFQQPNSDDFSQGISSNTFHQESSQEQQEDNFSETLSQDDFEDLSEQDIAPGNALSQDNAFDTREEDRSDTFADSFSQQEEAFQDTEEQQGFSYEEATNQENPSDFSTGQQIPFIYVPDQQLPFDQQENQDHQLLDQILPEISSKNQVDKVASFDSRSDGGILLSVRSQQGEGFGSEAQNDNFRDNSQQDDTQLYFNTGSRSQMDQDSIDITQPDDTSYDRSPPDSFQPGISSEGETHQNVPFDIADKRSSDGILLTQSVKSADSGYNDHGQDDFSLSHRSGNPVDWLRDSVPGNPGVDYPIFYQVPDTSFTCDQQAYSAGIYGDLESSCQVFHFCEENGGHHSFLCPNGTVFNQQHFVCDWWYNYNCDETPNFYNLNAELYSNIDAISPSQILSGQGISSQEEYYLGDQGLSERTDAAIREGLQPLSGQSNNFNFQSNTQEYPGTSFSGTNFNSDSLIQENEQQNSHQFDQENTARQTSPTISNFESRHISVKNTNFASQTSTTNGRRPENSFLPIKREDSSFISWGGSQQNSGNQELDEENHAVLNPETSEFSSEEIAQTLSTVSDSEQNRHHTIQKHTNEEFHHSDQNRNVQGKVEGNDIQPISDYPLGNRDAISLDDQNSDFVQNIHLGLTTNTSPGDDHRENWEFHQTHLQQQVQDTLSTDFDNNKEEEIKTTYNEDSFPADDIADELGTDNFKGQQQDTDSSVFAIKNQPETFISETNVDMGDNNEFSDYHSSTNEDKSQKTVEINQKSVFGNVIFPESSLQPEDQQIHYPIVDDSKHVHQLDDNDAPMENLQEINVNQVSVGNNINIPQNIPSNFVQEENIDATRNNPEFQNVLNGFQSRNVAFINTQSNSQQSEFENVNHSKSVSINNVNDSKTIQLSNLNIGQEHIEQVSFPDTTNQDYDMETHIQQLEPQNPQQHTQRDQQQSIQRHTQEIQFQSNQDVVVHQEKQDIPQQLIEHQFKQNIEEKQVSQHTGQRQPQQQFQQPQPQQQFQQPQSQQQFQQQPQQQFQQQQPQRHFQQQLPQQEFQQPQSQQQFQQQPQQQFQQQQPQRQFQQQLPQQQFRQPQQQFQQQQPQRQFHQQQPHKQFQQQQPQAQFQQQQPQHQLQQPQQQFLLQQPQQQSQKQSQQKIQSQQQTQQQPIEQFPRPPQQQFQQRQAQQQPQQQSQQTQQQFEQRNSQNQFQNQHHKQLQQQPQQQFQHQLQKQPQQQSQQSFQRRPDQQQFQQIPQQQQQNYPTQHEQQFLSQQQLQREEFQQKSINENFQENQRLSQHQLSQQQQQQSEDNEKFQQNRNQQGQHRPEGTDIKLPSLHQKPVEEQYFQEQLKHQQFQQSTFQQQPEQNQQGQQISVQNMQQFQRKPNQHQQFQQEPVQQQKFFNDDKQSIIEQTNNYQSQGVNKVPEQSLRFQPYGENLEQQRNLFNSKNINSEQTTVQHNLQQENIEITPPSKDYQQQDLTSSNRNFNIPTNGHQIQTQFSDINQDDRIKSNVRDTQKLSHAENYHDTQQNSRNLKNVPNFSRQARFDDQTLQIQKIGPDDTISYSQNLPIPMQPSAKYNGWRPIVKQYK